MARAYSLDLRERVVAFVASGQTTRAASAVFDVSVASRFFLALALTACERPTFPGGGIAPSPWRG